MSIQISTDTVSWYGAVVSTISFLTSFILSLYVILRNRSRVKVTFDSETRMLDASFAPIDDVDYICVNVTNKGQRPVKIDSVSLLYANSKKHYIMKSSFNPVINKVLTEEAPRTSFTAPSKEVNLQMLYCIVVMDAFGRKHKKYTTHFPTFLRVKNWLVSRQNKEDASNE